MNSIVRPRRKPMQSRAWMTSCAIQDAFVMLLADRGYEKISMREIAGLAGVGLGTLYLYFPGKESIAAVTIRRWMRKQAAILAQASKAPGPRTVEVAIRAMVQAYVRGLLGEVDEWRALLYLERRISSPASYREIYREFVDLFRAAFMASSDWPVGVDPLRTAFNAFSMVNAVVGQALLVQDVCPDAGELASDVECAVVGYIRSVQAQARRTGAMETCGPAPA
ncbi:TetR/AcrR family transcriptional regulator [Variovorax sp. V213]|uniref:TetR/AcrR family transcriptional regulator n=1 Tax=Variovorax sp. V213 TaxID=3065955 RepID=UPI0034E88362